MNDARKPTLRELVGNDQPDQLDEKIDQLEKQLEAEQDRRREDRFLALLIIMMLIDILLLDKSTNITVPVIVFILQIMFLLAVAKRMGIEQIAGLLDKVLDHFAKRN